VTDEQRQTAKKRTIRSFVRRGGRLTPPQQRALDELWPEMGIDFSAQALDLDEIFGRSAPRTLEIGFGNGQTLVQQAEENSSHDFIGIEVHEPGVGHCLLAAKEAEVSNLRLIAHDAIEVLQTQIPASSLQRINLYFPDPWPKKRHHKRRIVQDSFLSLCARCLRQGGALHAATDWENYAEHIAETLAQSALFDCVESRVHDGDDPLSRPVTKFERRGLRHGHRIWDWRFERVDG
jgi:tRNA (guanine-N7-)-methyltransferase